MPLLLLFSHFVQILLGAVSGVVEARSRTSLTLYGTHDDNEERKTTL